MSATGTILESEAISVRPLARVENLEKVAWGVILLSQVPLLLLHFRRIWLYEHYQYFPFVILAFAYFVWRRWPSEEDAHEPNPKLAIALASISFFLFAISTLLWASWLSAVAAIFTAGAMIVHFGGRVARDQLFSAWLLLWLLLPIPFGLDVQLIFELQTVASNAASYLLDFFGVDHLLSGHVLKIPKHEFLVEEACSGIHSLFSLLTFASILAIALRRTWFHSALLLASAVFWATSINIIRITTVVVAFTWFEVDLATAWKHETLGLILNGFALIMLYCTDQFILFFLERPDSSGRDFFLPDFYEDDLQGDGDAELDYLSTNPNRDFERRRVAQVASKSATNLRFTLALASLFGLLGALQGVVMVLKFDARRITGEASSQLNDAFDASTLPAQIGSWKQVNFKSEGRSLTSIHGSRYSAWSYENENVAAIVHINYPFMGWHNLPKCFIGQGWRVNSFERTIPQSQSGSDDGAFRLELDKPNGDVMHVRFCQFDLHGQPVLPPTEGQLTSWLKTTFDNSAGQWSWLSVDASTYQIVMQVTPKDRSVTIPPEDLTADFMKLRKQLVDTVLKSIRSDD